MDNAVEVPDEAMSRPADRRQRRPLRSRVWPILPLAFIGWWVIGALPWVVTGLHITPRLTTARETPPEPYLSTLPFLTSQLPLLVVLTLSAGGLRVAVLWSRPHTSKRRRLPPPSPGPSRDGLHGRPVGGAARQSAGLRR